MRQHAGWLVAGILCAFMFAGAAIGGPSSPDSYPGGVYNSGGITLSDGQSAPLQFDSTGKLQVAATATLTNPTIGAAVPSTGNYVAGNKGGLLTGLTLDGSSNLNVNCAAGCSASGSSFGAAFPATGQAIGMSQGGNLTALSGSSGNLLVALGAAVPAGANTIGAVTQASGPWAVTGSGTAGAAAAGVLSVQGIASMTPVQVSQATASNLNATVVGTGTFAVQAAATQSGNWTSRVVGNAGATVDATVGAGTAPTNMFVGGALYNSTEISPTTGQSFALQADSKGRLRNVIMDAAGNTRGANVNASNQLSVSLDGSSATNISTNIAQMNGVATTMGNGVSGTGVQRVTIASDSTGQVALAAGTATVGGTFPSASATVGGLTLSTTTLAASTNATNVKNSAGQLYAISGFNMSSATPVWVSLYNNSGTPTCGTGIVYQFLIPGSTTGAGFIHDFSVPLQFSSGIAFCATTGIAGTGNPAATTYVLNLGYK